MTTPIIKVRSPNLLDSNDKSNERSNDKTIRDLNRGLNISEITDKNNNFLYVQDQDYSQLVLLVPDSSSNENSKKI